MIRKLTLHNFDSMVNRPRIRPRILECRGVNSFIREYSWTVFAFLVTIFLASCAVPTEIPVPSPAITVTQLPIASPIETLTASRTPTPEPTATEASYDVDAETARQKVIIENAPNNVQEFSYLQSDEYLASLREKNEKGELPQISPNASFVEPTDLNLRYEELEKNPSNVFIKYGGDIAFTFERSWRWRLPENRPWVVVDAGVTEIGNSKVFFHVLKWRNSDGSETFWGRLFMLPDVTNLTDMFLQFIDRNGLAYPSVVYYKSVSDCSRSLTKYDILNTGDYCDLVGSNPDSAVPKNVLQDWRKTGILQLNFLPWSASGTQPLK